jgi:hypothetical protein
MNRYWYTDGYYELQVDEYPLNVRYVERGYIGLDYAGSELLAIF